MDIVSHHLLRRRARAKAYALNATHLPGVRYRVVQAQRGPWRWYVIRDQRDH
jgi:ribosomal protein S12